MPESDNLGSFIKENKKLVQEWIDTRLEIYKLRFISIFSKSAGYLIWVLVSLFLSSLLIIFLGLTTGFWLSEITGSYAAGFGLTSLILLFMIILIYLLRKALFINPIIKKIISKADEETETKE